MGKLFDNFEHEGNSNLKFVISFWLLNIPTVTLYCTALTGIFKKTKIDNPPEHLNKIFPLKVKTSKSEKDQKMYRLLLIEIRVGDIITK